MFVVVCMAAAAASGRDGGGGGQIWHPRARAQYGWTALMSATSGGHTDCVRLLLDAGADKNATSKVCAASDLRACCVGQW